MKKIVVLFCCVLFLFSCKEKNTDRVVEIITSYGNIKVKLYDETPIHRDNFIKLVNDSAYDGILFHRVIENFMIQAGDPDSKDSAAGVLLGESSIGEDLPAEILPQLFHKKGVIAAARESDNVNPERKSSASQFYLVQGRVYTPEELSERVERINVNREEDPLVLTEEQKLAYTTIGGTPHLDGRYTVFGEIIEGLDVVDKIAAVETDKNNRPIENVVIKGVRIVKD